MLEQYAGLLLLLLLPPPWNGGMAPFVAGVGANWAGAVTWPGHWLLRELSFRFFWLRPRGVWCGGIVVLVGGGTHVL